MVKTVDARGLSCPQPVLLTLEEIKAGTADALVVIVDNEVSKENVSRAALNRGWTIAKIEERDGEFQMTLKKTAP